MWSLSWLFGKEEEEAPAEPLVLGALLRCEYGARPTFLYVEADDIDINALPQACVEDTKAHINIQPFGACQKNDDCTFKMDPDDRWVNAEPQNVRVNGKEIITTRSTLLCRATGMTIRPVTSGQDGKFARFLLFLRDMDCRYPGLREVLEDPYGDLYLEGRYEAALRFLGDQVDGQEGGLEIITLYDPDDLEGAYMLAALERLLVDHDVRSFEGFMEDLTSTAIERDMEGAEGWDKNYLNEAMLELLRIDCQETARRIETDPAYRWMVQNKMFSSWLRESTSAVAYTAVLYASMLAASNVLEKRVEDTVDEETKEAVDQEGGDEAWDRDSFRKNEDPFRDVLGPGMRSNPEEWDALIKEMEDNGVEIVYREGAMAYAPKNGRAGQLFVDPDSSYSALLHEYTHYLDDVSAGYPGMEHHFQTINRVKMELHAYMQEIKLADSLGYKEVAEQLFENDRVERGILTGHLK